MFPKKDGKMTANTEYGMFEGEKTKNPLNKKAE